MPARRLRAFFLSTAVAAALALGPAEAETLTDALIKAYQTSPFLESSRAALRSIDETVPQARANQRPQVSLGAGGQLTSNDDDFLDTSDLYFAELTASLLIYDHGQTRAASARGRRAVAAGRADLREAEQQVLFDAVAAYMDVRQGLEFVSITENNVEVLEEELRATNNRFEVGEVTRTDVSLTEARLEQVRALLADARGNLGLARQSYLQAVGTLPGDLAPPPRLPELPATPREGEALALRQNPAIVAAQFAERGAIADFDRALAAKGPSVNTSVGLSYDGAQSIGRGDSGQAQVELSGSIPLYTGGRNDSLVRQAQAVLDQRRFNLQEAGRAVIEQVNTAYIQRAVAEATIVANRRQLAASEIALAGVTEEARLGARSTLDVLTADQDRLDAAAEVVRSLRNEYVAAYSILQAVGLLTVRHLNLGIETYDSDEYFSAVQRAPIGGYDTSAVDRIRSRWQRN